DCQSDNGAIVAGKRGNLLHVWHAEQVDDLAGGGCDIPAVGSKRVRKEQRETRCKTYCLIIFVEPQNWQIVFLAYPLPVKPLPVLIVKLGPLYTIWAMHKPGMIKPGLILEQTGGRQVPIILRIP